MVNIAYNEQFVKAEPWICVPISVNNHKKALKLAKLASKKANLVEIWLDKFSFKDINWLIPRLPKPFIIVAKKGKNRLEKLVLASKLGASFADIDIKDAAEIQKFKKQRRKNTKLIISYHNFKNTPDLNFLVRQVKKMFTLGADIVKIATFIKKPHENVILFELTARFKRFGKKIIVIGMGDAGRISRIAGPYLGSFLTYVALNEKMRTAKSQFTLKDVT